MGRRTGGQFLGGSAERNYREGCRQTEETGMGIGLAREVGTNRNEHTVRVTGDWR